MEIIQIEPPSKWPLLKKIFLAGGAFLGALFLVLIIFVWYWSMPLSLAPRGVRFEVEEGVTVVELAEKLTKEKIIRSSALFRIYLTITGGDRKLKPGIYLFAEPQNAFWLAERIRRGDFGVAMIKVTIPEGATNIEIGKILAKALPEFSQSEFAKIASSLEGKLFPETYFLSPLATPTQIAKILYQTYQRKIAPLKQMISDSGKSEDEILTMASILEEEANTFESKKIISGILWRRLDSGMKLQVDAVFPYIMSKNTFDLTRKDLATSSPYNTYKYKGLPPGPISNPGLDSILAALNPEKTSYVFYLSDKTGKMHYADTYAEHLKNKKKYLGT